MALANHGLGLHEPREVAQGQFATAAQVGGRVWALANDFFNNEFDEFGVGTSFLGSRDQAWLLGTTNTESFNVNVRALHFKHPKCLL